MEQRCFAACFQNEMRAEDEHARFAQHVGVRRGRLSILKDLAVDQVQDFFDDIPADEKRPVVWLDWRTGAAYRGIFRKSLSGECLPES